VTLRLQRRRTLRTGLTACLAALFLALAGAGPRSTHRILFVHSVSPASPYTAVQRDAAMEVLRDRFAERAIFMEESLGIDRPMKGDQAELLCRLFEDRYARVGVDIVLTTDTAALEFIAAHRDTLFVGKPVVFSAAIRVPEIAEAPDSGFTGVTEQVDAQRTVEVIRDLHPECRTIVAISSHGEYAERLESLVRAAVESRTDGTTLAVVQSQYGEPEQLLDRLADGAPDEVFLYLVAHDPSRRARRAEDILPEFSAHASRPIYALYDTYVGRGVVGGAVASAAASGQRAGEIASLILLGAPVDSIPIEVAPNPLMFDDRQLERWGIPEGALPAGAVILNNDPSFWKANREAILITGIGAAVLIPTLGLFAGLWARARRAARSLAEARDQQVEVAASLGIGLIVQNDEGRITDANRMAERILGRTKDQITALKSDDARWRSVHPDGSPMSGDQLPSIMALRTGRPQLDRVVGVHRPDGSLVWISANAVPLKGTDGPSPRFTVTTFADITAERAAVEWQSGVSDVLRRLALDEPLTSVLETLCLAVERRMPGMVCTILLLDDDGLRLRHGAAPSLPLEVWKPVDGVPIGPTMGSCGTAAYTKQRVIVEDIATSPLWDGIRDLHLKHDLRACWSEPVRAPDGAVIGTLALYYRQPRTPSDPESDLIESAATIAGIAISKNRREQRIRESDERFRTLSENVPGVLYSYIISPDLKRHTLFMSPYLERLLGPVNAAAVRADMQHFFDLIHPDDIERVNGLASESRRTCAPIEIEYRVRTDAGDYRWVRGVSAPVRLEDGSLRAHGILLDITETRHAERARQEAEERLSTLSEHVPGALFTYVTTPDGDRHSCLLSPYFDRLVGPIAGARVRHRVNDIFTMIHPDDLQRVRDRGDRCRANQLPFECEYRLRTDAGEYRWVRGVSTPEPLANGETRWHGLLLDIDAAKRSEEALRASEARLRSLTDNIPGAVYRSVMHPDGSRTLLFASREYESVIGRPPVIGHLPYNERDVRYYPGDIARMRDAFIQAGRRQEPVDIDTRIMLPSGEFRWVKVRSSPTPLEGGDVLWDGVIFDIHEQKCAQEEVLRLARARAILLEELDHRVKNSLSGLLTLIDITSQPSTSAAEFAQAIRSRVHAMATTHTLLSRTHWQPISLEALIRALIPEGLADRVSVNGPAALIASTQATAVGMVIQELLTNATKHGALKGSAGFVEVSWVLSSAPDDRSAVALDWRESGGATIDDAPPPGIGSSLVEGLLGFELGGAAQLRYPPDGAHHTLRFSIDASTRTAEDAHANGAALTPTPTA